MCGHFLICFYLLSLYHYSLKHDDDDEWFDEWFDGDDDDDERFDEWLDEWFDEW